MAHQVVQDGLRRPKGDSSIGKSICLVGELLFRRGLIGGTDGNLSVRIADDRFLVTRSGSCLGTLEPSDIVEIDAKGNPLTAGARPSSERWLHLAAYAERPDRSAAVHAHPATVVALTLAGLSMDVSGLPEALLAFGEVPTAAYATPGTPEGADAIREPIRRSDAVVLDRHGAFTMGRTLTEAFHRMDQLEHAAKIIHAARQLGSIQALPAGAAEKLAELRKSLGLAR